jgi:hypothetical protein
MTEELDESGTTAEEQAVAEAPQYEAEPAGELTKGRLVACGADPSMRTTDKAPP